MFNQENSDQKRSFRKKPFRKRKEKSEFEQKVIDIARVTRVVKGGKRFSFRTTMVIGDKKGRVGVGIAKGSDMKISTEKAFANAKKALVTIKISGNTIPYKVHQKVVSARIMLKPSAKGSGVVAGGAVRAVVSLAGISDISGKMLGSENKLSNARATVKALEQFSVKKTREIALEAKKKEREEEKRKKKENEEKAEKKESEENKKNTKKIDKTEKVGAKK